MTKRHSVLCACVLAASMLLSAVSCAAGSNAGQDETPVSAPESDAAVVPEEETQLHPELPDKTFDGAEVMFLTSKHLGFDWYTSHEIYAEEMDGTLINDAVFTRNAQIEKDLDIHIAQTQQPDCHQIARKSIKSDENVYDVVMPYINSTIALATEGLLLDLNTLPWLDLTHPWWDQRANENMLIADKLFITTGDIAILDNECTMVMFFNKQMIADYQLDNPYELVREKGWTLDKVREMASVVTADANGDGKMTHDDVWGLSIAGNAPISMYFGAGERIVDKNEEGTLSFVIGSPRSFDVFDKVTSLCYDDKMLSDHTTGDAGYNTVAKMFNASQVMMVTFALVDINGMREAEFEFGILPYPLYDENQPEYNNLISTGLVSSVSVPVTCKDPELVGVTLEAMAYASLSTLTPAYYDNALKTRYVRDEESGDMLDIIFATRVYDLGFISDWGGAGSLVTNLYYSKSTDLASSWQRIQKVAQKQLDKALESFAGLQ
ncbi:MAG: extracellular solute-binding protein [Clostridia bacterium]|nr:extracellular solute-binding protein [Clostridia bacterium]